MASTQTIKASLISKINFPLPEESYITALIEADLDGDGVYTKDKKKQIELCAAELILVVCTSGNVSEGGYSLSLADKESLLKIRSLFLSNWGVSDGLTPKIEDGTGLW